MKIKFWDIKNVIVSLKTIATSIVTSLILGIPMFLARWFIINDRLMVGRGVQLLSFLAGFLIFGWFARKWWKWK